MHCFRCLFKGTARIRVRIVSEPPSSFVAFNKPVGFYLDNDNAFIWYQDHEIGFAFDPSCMAGQVQTVQNNPSFSTRVIPEFTKMNPLPFWSIRRAS